MSKEEVLIDQGSEPKNEEPKAKKIDFASIKKDKIKDLSKPSIGTYSIDDFLSEYQNEATVTEAPSMDTGNDEPVKPKRGRRKKQDKMFISGEVISGAMFITLIDLIIPMSIVTLNNTLDKSGRKMKVDELRMKASQRKELEPIAEEVMRELEVKANPIVIMIVSLISIYGLNFMNIKYSLD